jgi:hypothetical protein
VSCCAGKEISIVARKALVKIAKLLQNVFNETGVEEDATSPELSQNFIRSCIPKFHSTIFMITVRPPHAVCACVCVRRLLNGVCASTGGPSSERFGY